MRHLLLISALTVSVFRAWAQDPDFEFELPQIPAIQISAVEEGTEKPVPYASISLEYADTVLTETTDENGLLDFTPLSFPLTLTATCEGMEEATYGLFEHPEEPITIVMTRQPETEGHDLSAGIRPHHIKNESLTVN